MTISILFKHKILSFYKMRTGRVYMIYNSDKSIIYVGATFQQIKKRWINHKTKTETTISQIMKQQGSNKFKISLIKEYKVCDKKHLNVYETLWINKLKTINKCTPFNFAKLYKKDYMLKNKDKKKIYDVEYKKKNYAKIMKQHSDRWKANPERREFRKGYMKEYYEKNKIKFNTREKITCECGATVRKSGLTRHKKTEKHEKLLAII